VWTLKFRGGQVLRKGPKYRHCPRQAWDYVHKRVEFVSHLNIWTNFKSIIHIQQKQKFVKFCSWSVESCLFWHIFPSFLVYFEKQMTCFRYSLNMALEWYLTFSTKQCFKPLKRGHDISEKRGPRQLPRYLSLLSIPEFALSCWQGACD